MPQKGPQSCPVTLVSLQLYLLFTSLHLRQSYFERTGIDFSHVEFLPVPVFPNSEQQHTEKPSEAACRKALSGCTRHQAATEGRVCLQTPRVIRHRKPTCV